MNGRNWELNEEFFTVALSRDWAQNAVVECCDKPFVVMQDWDSALNVLSMPNKKSFAVMEGGDSVPSRLMVSLNYCIFIHICKKKLSLHAWYFRFSLCCVSKYLELS